MVAEDVVVCDIVWYACYCYDDYKWIFYLFIIFNVAIVNEAEKFIAF